jgi:CDP-glucose 4,6-dehydratase
VFKNVYSGKKVLITGHTGFKGTWLTAWLLKLGAHVIGYSKDIPTNPSMFAALSLENNIDHHLGDICNLDNLKRVIFDARPDYIFHLAAQAIVSTSYINPTETFLTNAVGTMNVLECLRGIDHVCTVLLITSDKCYDNVESIYGYKEVDQLGGKDIYSGSKGAAELIIKSYFNSFLNKSDNVRIGIGRAGNVIGGGDWGADRIVADSMRAWSSGNQVLIRSPNSTRPWQHVLEPLSGYLSLGMHLSENNFFNGEAFNFGPRAEQNRTVIELLNDLSIKCDIGTPINPYTVVENIPFHEASLLKLNCDKALFYLKWQSTLNYPTMIEYVRDWYFNFYKIKSNFLDVTNEQISNYESLALNTNANWTN